MPSNERNASSAARAALPLERAVGWHVTAGARRSLALARHWNEPKPVDQLLWRRRGEAVSSVERERVGRSVDCDRTRVTERQGSFEES